MKILIVGLGNPGEKYLHNRHNVGFMFVDYILNKATTDNGLPTTTYSFDKYTKAELAKINVPTRLPAGEAVNAQCEALLAKPHTFMNRSGEAVKKLTTFYDLQSTNLIVAHDDLDLNLGDFKISNGKGPLMHNGIGSIEAHMHTKDFWRIRIGINNRDPEQRIPGETYVLSDFTEEERKILTETFPSIYDRLWEQMSLLG